MGISTIGWGEGAAQEHPLVIAAARAHDSLDYATAIDAATRSLAMTLTKLDRETAYEILAYSYASLDSTTRAVEAFRDLILLNPDREPNPLIISPTITQLYANALSQVLVIRRVSMDSTTFDPWNDYVRVGFDVSRSATVEIRIVGSDVDFAMGSGTYAGESEWRWSGMGDNNRPLPAGDYQIRLTARSAREEYQQLIALEIRHVELDTLEHLTSLPGFDERPELTRPPRNWTPAALSVLGAGAASLAVFAVEGSTGNRLQRRELFLIDALTILTGVFVSLRQPDPTPNEANIAFNQLLRRQLANENEARATLNQQLRTQVLLTVVPIHGERP